MLILYFPKMMPFKVPFLTMPIEQTATTADGTPVSQTVITPIPDTVPSAFGDFVSYEDEPQREISASYLGDVKRSLLTSESASSFDFSKESNRVSFFSTLENTSKTLSVKDGLVLICLDTAWRTQNIDFSGLFEEYIGDLVDNSNVYSLEEKLAFIDKYLVEFKEIKISSISPKEEVLVVIYSLECQ